MERSEIPPSLAKSKQPKSPLKVFYGSRFLHILQAFLNHVMSSVDAMYLMVWWYQLPFTRDLFACNHIILAA